MNVTVRLEIFSRPQEIENSRQYLLLRTDIYRKQSLGASGSYTSARLFTHILNVSLACENSRFASLFAAGDVSRGDVCNSATEIRY